MLKKKHIYNSVCQPTRAKLNNTKNKCDYCVCAQDNDDTQTIYRVALTSSDQHVSNMSFTEHLFNINTKQILTLRTATWMILLMMAQ